MVVDHRPEFDFLDLDDFLFFAGFGGLLLLGIFVLAVIEQLDHWRGRVGRNLDEVEAGLLGEGQRFGNGNGPLVGAVLVDQVYLADTDLLVDARTLLLDGLRGSHRTANGDFLLMLLTRTCTLTRASK